MIFLSSSLIAFFVLVLILKAYPYLNRIFFICRDFFGERKILLYRQRLRRSFQKQEVELVNQIAGGLSAGLSLEQAFALSADELGEPLKGRLKKILVEMRLGKDLGGELFKFGEEVGDEDLLIIAHSIDVLSEVGGNLVVKFRGLAELIGERESVISKIRSQQLQGIMQGALLASLPVGLMFVLNFIAPSYLSPLFETPVGLLVLVASLLWEVFGIFVMMRMSRIRV